MLLTSEGVYSEGLVVALLQLGEKGPLAQRCGCCCCCASAGGGAVVVVIIGALEAGNSAVAGGGPL